MEFQLRWSFSTERSAGESGCWTLKQFESSFGHWNVRWIFDRYIQMTTGHCKLLSCPNSSPPISQGKLAVNPTSADVAVPVLNAGLPAEWVEELPEAGEQAGPVGPDLIDWPFLDIQPWESCFFLSLSFSLLLAPNYLYRLLTRMTTLKKYPFSFVPNMYNKVYHNPFPISC